ncbi:MAG: hypothetical protein IJD50_07100 [Clostridia bacterium]|nr:hypothetical protein [Clostridia bacterium]
MPDERLLKIKENEVQEHLDGLPSGLRSTIHEYVPDCEFIIAYPSKSQAEGGQSLFNQDNSRLD